MNETAARTRGVLLCADDYALHPRVDEGVQRLAEAGRLSATSCMSTAPGWRRAGLALQALRSHLQLGLHFNLTEGHGGTHPAQSLGQVLLRAYRRGFDKSELRQQWQRQLDAFEDVAGSAPDFIDGHQHVHQLPQLRDVLLDELQARYGADAPWLRSTVPAHSAWRQPKALVIAALGGWTATRRWRRAGLRGNRGFAGVYGFDAPDAASYGRHMASWLRAAPDGLLLMCHPAAGPVPEDAIGHQRAIEFDYLMSAAFGRLLQQEGLHVHQGPDEQPGGT